MRQRWQSAWTQHLRSTSLDTSQGFFSWKTYDSNQEENQEDHVIELLHSIQPRLKDGLTIALLVRSGKEATKWLETLRHAGIEALSESTPPVGRDNPVAAAFHSALSLSVHPGDSFARNHLLMKPLRGIFFPKNNPQEELPLLIQHIAKLLAEGGFTAVTKWILEKLSPLIHDDFSKNRSAALLRAARKADHSAMTDVDEFLSMLEGYEEQGRSTPQAVQIMTIHKSKGLEFDMVLIPLVAPQQAIDSLRGSELQEHRNAQGETFLLKLPAEEIRNVPGNETLALAANQQRLDCAFEELCVWYVALSRAKRALYIVSPEPKKLDAGKCPNIPQLLASGLTCLPGFNNGMLGDPLWYQSFHPHSVEHTDDALPHVLCFPARPPSLKKSTPSDSSHHLLRGENAFLANDAAMLGSEVHRYFETVDWITGDTWPHLHNISLEVRELLATSLSHPAMISLFTKPECPYTLWREQRFDLVIEGKWISGCFDRVVIFRDEQGRATGADLIDFKTDQGGRAKLILNYHSQLESYRRSLEQILALPESKIRMILVHVRSNDPVVLLP